MSIERPHKNLMRIYLLQALATVVGFPFVILPLYFKYHTLRYKFDEEGISASWGIIFRREIYLTYRRIQDIHVTRNLFERWLGIGKVQLQTAAGSSAAELVLEGMDEYASVRDFFYRRMRGTSDDDAAQTGSEDSDVVALLEEIKGELDGVRAAIEQGRS